MAKKFGEQLGHDDQNRGMTVVFIPGYSAGHRFCRMGADQGAHP